MQQQQQPEHEPTAEWARQRQTLLAQQRRLLGGADWLQLSQCSAALLAPQLGANLHIETLNNATQAQTRHLQQRLTSLPSGCADLIFCDPIIQQHSQPQLLAQELQHLLRPGGRVVLSGAGSLRGRIAAGVDSSALSLQQVLALFSGSKLQLEACYHHGSQAQHPPWRGQLEAWNRKLSTAANQRLPWLLPLFLHWAAMRPGWVLILSDRRRRPSGLGSTARTAKISLKPAAGTAATGHCRQPSAHQ